MSHKNAKRKVVSIMKISILKKNLHDMKGGVVVFLNPL